MIDYIRSKDELDFFVLNDPEFFGWDDSLPSVKYGHVTQNRVKVGKTEKYSV